MSEKHRNLFCVAILAAMLMLPACGCSWAGQLVRGTFDNAIHKKQRENESPDQRAARKEQGYYDDFHRKKQQEELERQYPPSKPKDVLYDRTF